MQLMPVLSFFRTEAFSATPAGHPRPPPPLQQFREPSTRTLPMCSSSNNNTTAAARATTAARSRASVATHRRGAPLKRSRRSTHSNSSSNNIRPRAPLAPSSPLQTTPSRPRESDSETPSLSSVLRAAADPRSLRKTTLCRRRPTGSRRTPPCAAAARRPGTPPPATAMAILLPTARPPQLWTWHLFRHLRHPLWDLRKSKPFTATLSRRSTTTDLPCGTALEKEA